MTGEMTIKCITKDGREGLIVRTCFKEVGEENCLQVMQAVATALHMKPFLVSLWANMYTTGAADIMYSAEKVYDHDVCSNDQTHQESEESDKRSQVLRELDELFKEILGGNIR